MPARWSIEFWPICAQDAFLSHCQEDRESLIKPVYEGLKQQAIAPWADWHNYPSGRIASEVLREELLGCRHVIYFITPSALKQGRGWMSVERAYSAAIQERLCYGQEVAHYELMLLLVPPTRAAFSRSCWSSLIDKSRRCPVAPPARSKPWTNDHIQWCIDSIASFVKQEKQWAVDLRERYAQDHGLRAHFAGERHLQQRILYESIFPID